MKMIKAIDVRIGNYAIYEGKIYKLSAASILDLSRNEGKEFEAIPITEDWLLKFGFTNIDQTNIYVKSMHKIGGEKLKSIAVYIDEENYTVAIVDYYAGVEKTDLLHLDYEYVHQLQNLYYALTGLDLSVS
jgi:hypothetical protein